MHLILTKHCCKWMIAILILIFFCRNFRQFVSKNGGWFILVYAKSYTWRKERVNNIIERKKKKREREGDKEKERERERELWGKRERERDKEKGKRERRWKKLEKY